MVFRKKSLYLPDPFFNRGVYARHLDPVAGGEYHSLVNAIVGNEFFKGLADRVNGERKFFPYVNRSGPVVKPYDYEVHGLAPPSFKSPCPSPRSTYIMSEDASSTQNAMTEYFADFLPRQSVVSRPCKSAA